MSPLGEIADLKSAGVVTESEWSAAASLQDEARMLFHNLVDTISNKIYTSAATSQYRNTTTTSEHPIQTIGESTSFPSNTGIFQLEGTITHKKIPDQASSIFHPLVCFNRTKLQKYLWRLCGLIIGKILSVCSRLT